MWLLTWVHTWDDVSSKPPPKSKEAWRAASCPAACQDVLMSEHLVSAGLCTRRLLPTSQRTRPGSAKATLTGGWAQVQHSCMLLTAADSGGPVHRMDRCLGTVPCMAERTVAMPMGKRHSCDSFLRSPPQGTGQLARCCVQTKRQLCGHGR